MRIIHRCSLAVHSLNTILKCSLVVRTRSQCHELSCSIETPVHMISYPSILHYDNHFKFFVTLLLNEGTNILFVVLFYFALL